MTIKIKKYPSLGNTLIELLMYAAIFVILIAVLIQMFSSTIDTQLGSEAISSVQEDGQYILSRLTYDIQRAQSITVPASLGTSSTSLQIVIDGANYTYSLNNGNLQLATTTVDVLNGYDTGISGLNFKLLGNLNGKPAVNFSFTVTTKVTNHTIPQSQTFQTTVGTR